LRGRRTGFQDGVAAGEGFLCVPFWGVHICVWGEYHTHINNSSCCILVHHFIKATSITLILTYKWSLHWTVCFPSAATCSTLVLLPLVVMLGRTQQKSQFVSIVVTALVLLCGNILLALVLLHSNVLLVTMEMKSTRCCIVTNICRLLLMWEVPTCDYSAAWVWCMV
jgi:hypothetical protein